MANSRTCLKKHSCNLHANCDAHLAESLFQTCSGIETSKIPAVKITINSS
ncbi:DUF6783 domain-containing protein [Blautia faecis]